MFARRYPKPPRLPLLEKSRMRGGDDVLHGDDGEEKEGEEKDLKRQRRACAWNFA